ncbi:caspase family protein [Pedobacter polaris]|nr:caspase family protein [Pedobacter polaris]
MAPTGHVLSVSDVDFSKDGKYMVTVADNEIKFWETETGRLIYNLKGNSYEGFINNGKTLITTELKNDSIGKIKFWDLNSGEVIDSLPGITVRFSDDESLMLLSSGLDSVDIIQVKTKKKIGSLPGSIGFFVNSDKLIFTATILADDTGYKMMFWDAKTHKHINQYNAALAGASKNLFVLEHDSTSKILDLNKNEIVQVFNRPKYNDSKNHISYKMKFSPDHKLLMFFPRDNYVAIIDNETYALKKTLNLGFNIRDLIFNEDGSMFITTDEDSSATAWDTKTFEKLYSLKGHKKWINELVFSKDNKSILTSSFDNTAILWNAKDGSFIRTFTGKNATINKSLMSTNGDFIAQQSGDYIFVWETKTAKKIASIKCKSDQIRFSSDNKYLIVNQNYGSSASETRTLILDLNIQKIVKDLYFRGNPNKYIISNDAQYFSVFNDTAKALNVFDLDDNLVLSIKTPEGKIITNSNFSQDHQTLIICYQLTSGDRTGRELVAYQLSNKQQLWNYRNRLIYDDFTVTKNNKYLIARMAADSLICLDLKTGESFYMSFESKGSKWSDRTIESSVDGKYLWVYDSYGLSVFDLISRKQIINHKSEDWITMVNISNDGYLIVGDVANHLNYIQLSTGKTTKTLTTRGYASAFSNGYLLTSDRTFLHLHKDTKLLYSLLNVEENDQIIVDPSGRYDGTEAARKLLYFTCGKEIISLEQVKDLLWVPNLAERISKAEVINAPKLSDLAICGLTPEVESIDNKTDQHEFKINPRKGGLGETVLYINEIEVKRYLPNQLVKIGLSYSLKIPKTSLASYFIAGKENFVTVKAYTAKNDISSRGAKVTNLKTPVSSLPPNLYAVVVGVSDYKGTELDLKYAAKDANDIANALGNSARKLLNTDGKEHVFIYNLNTSKEGQFPEKLSIKNAIADVGKKATANDVFIVFFAGHGVMEGAKKQFYFLTADASKASLAAQVGISTDELSEWMKPANIKAQKRILIFDACNSGQAVNELVKIGQANQQYLAARNDDKSQQIKTIEKLNEKSGLFILSASASNQSAYEMGRFSQGLLTYALLKAMKEQPAILDDNKFLNVGKWFTAAEKTVSDIVRESGNRQEPQVVSMSNFNIGIVDQEVMAKIILPQEKALFASSNFQNNDEAIADDDLELSKSINQALNNISSRGVDANITYVIGTNSPEAFALSGRYEVKGDEIIVKVNIRQHKEIKHRFELKGKKENLAALAETIVQLAAQWSARKE